MQMCDQRQQRDMFDNVADISGVIEMTVIHQEPVPEPETGCNGDVDALVRTAYADEAAGNLALAAQRFRTVVTAAPDHAEAWGALGQILAQNGEHDSAAEALTTALALDPGRSDLVLLLADLYRRQGRLDDAEDEVRTFLRLRPDSRPVLGLLAEILAAQQRYGDAAALGRELALLGPLPGVFTRDFADWLTHTGAHRDALHYLTGYLASCGEDTEGWLQLGSLWLAVQEPDKAAAAWERYRTLCPDDPAHTVARLAAWRESAAKAALSPDYVRALFDGYAGSFEHDVLGKLQYRAPQLLRQAVARVRPGAARLDILDLGCGTGLAGKAFADMAATMTGVDLAPNMLQQAEKTGLYRDLAAADLVPWLQTTSQRFDLVLAADVLCYLGELKPLFAGVRRVLRPDGLFAATVEQMPPDFDGNYLLQPQRRYAHGENYVLGVAQRHLLRLRALDFVTLRHEAGCAVPGMAFVLEA